MSFNKKFFATGGIVASSADAVCNTDTADIFGDGNGKALYTFDYDGSDESANGYHLTPTGVFFGVDGNINYGLRGGESNSMMANTSIGYNYSDITVSWWVKLEGTGSTRLTFSNGGGLRFAFMRIHYNTTASQYRADLFTRTGTSSGTNSLVGYALIDTSLNGSWVHLAMRMGNTLEDSVRNGIYINGTKSTMSYSVGSATSSAGVDDAAPNRFYIGYYYSSALQEPFSIDIDHLRIFNRALTASEIGQLSAEEACVHTATANTADFPSTATTLAHYPLDNSAEDNKGTNDGSEVNTIEYRFGKYGQSAVFTGSNYINTNLKGQRQGAVSLWFKRNGNPSGGEVLIASQIGSSSNRGIWLNIQTDGTIRSLISIGTSGTHGAAINSTSTNSADGNWHHVVYSWDLSQSGTNVFLYFDGQLENSASSSSASWTTQNMTENYLLGRYATSTTNLSLNGQIDQVRIFSQALDETTNGEITALYNEKPEADTSNFKTVLYEGTGATQYISNIGYNLDAENGGDGGLVWIKERTSTSSHRIVDSVRGDTIRIFTNSNGAESSTTEGEILEANGFFIGADNGSNQNGEDYVAWVFRGGGQAITDSTTGDLTANISANTEAGFSIVNFTGVTATPDGVTVPHGLNSAPELVILKPISVSGDWQVYAYPVGNNKRLKLNDDVEATTTTGWDNTHPDSNNVTMEWSTISKEYIMYCWHSVSGYSKIGTYSGGQGSSDIIATGFEPSWVMIKNTTNAHDWCIFDNRRDAANGYMLEANDFAIESQHSDRQITFVSTGFKINATTSQAVNLTSNTYLYMAFK